jgi:hypothetical protein|tara:strand:+ start:1629 stop:1955 length:327 start_codon:yes stop_codon:yes gene_type:complete
MRLLQAMRDKIDMYDKCINALTTVGHEPEPDTPAWDMVYFLEEERNRVRNELKELEDGTHELFAPFKAFIESDDPDAKALRESVDPRLFNPGDMSNADIATMLLDMKD